MDLRTMGEHEDHENTENKDTSNDLAKRWSFKNAKILGQHERNQNRERGTARTPQKRRVSDEAARAA